MKRNKLTASINKNKTLSVQEISEKITQELTPIKESLDKYFSRSETKESAFYYLRGLISVAERKNSWQLSEQTGYENPYAFQYLLGRALWEENKLRDEVSRYTVEHLGTTDGIASLDETGFLKKGKKSAGVGRQYSGTAGRIENCQIGVFLSYATSRGRALIDRELYIPKDWFTDKKRCREAGIPEEITFKTKPELAKEMLIKMYQNNIRPAWVVGDEVYGCHTLRAWLEEHQQSYALAVASNYYITRELTQHKISDLLKEINQEQWKIISVGEGTKGYRYYEWCRIKINSLSLPGWSRWAMLRRSIKNPEDIAFYITFSPDTQSLEDMAKAAGSRWTIEECFEMAKGEVGLDQYEVRNWTGWYRHITLSMFALSFLVKLRYQLEQSELKLHQKKTLRKPSPMKNFLKSRGLH